jgi:hypothetical protein
VSKYKEGILVTEYPENAKIDCSEIEQVYDEQRALSNGKPYCVLIKTHGIALITEKAMGCSKSDYAGLTKAVAVLIDPDKAYFEYSKQLLWIIKNIDKPKFEMEIFENEENAMHWLEDFVKKV